MRISTDNRQVDGPEYLPISLGFLVSVVLSYKQVPTLAPRWPIVSIRPVERNRMRRRPFTPPERSLIPVFRLSYTMPTPKDTQNLDIFLSL